MAGYFSQKQQESNKPKGGYFANRAAEKPNDNPIIKADPNKIEQLKASSTVGLSPAQQIVKKYSSGQFKGDELKLGIKELNNIARQNTKLAPKMDGTVTQDDIKQAMELRDKLQRQTAGTAGAMGFFNSASFGFAKNSNEETKQMYKEVQQAQPVAYTAGAFAGEAAKYGAVGTALGANAKFAALQKGKLPARLAAGRIADIIPDAVTAAQETDNAGDFTKQLIKDQAIGLAFDGALEAIPMAYRAVKGRLPLRGQSLPQGLPDAVKTLDDLKLPNKSFAVAEPKLAPAVERKLPRYEELSFVKKANTVGAMEYNPKSFSGLQNEYGTIPPGEKAFREPNVPKRTEPNNKVRQFTRTMMEAKQTPESLIQEFESQVADGVFSYNPKTDKEALGYAVKSIEDKGFDGAMSQWDDVVNGRRKATKDDMALGQMLYAVAAKNEDSGTAMRLAAEIAAEGTRLGQSVQAMRLLKKTSPEGRLYYAQKTADNLTKQLKDRLGVKAPDIKLDESVVKEYMTAMNTGDPQAIDAAMGNVIQNIADQVPATLADKWNAWRYLAMLGNPRTHIRNIVGNSLFYGTTKVKNLVGSVLEEAEAARRRAIGKDAFLRSKTLAKPTAAQFDFAKQDFELMQDVISGTGKYNPADLIQDKRRIFNNDLIEKWRKGNMGALEAEDKLFLNRNYVDSMAKYLRANELDPAAMSKAQINQAREYAVNEAKRATFRDDSAVAVSLNNLAKTKGMNLIMGALMPFTKTPINILKRGFEYSPANIAKALYDMRKGIKPAQEVIDELASGLTGTGIMLLGAHLAQKGYLTAGGTGDSAQDALNRLQGDQNYAAQTEKGSYTLDWAAPTAMPLFMGAELYQISRGENISYGDFIEALMRMSEPVVEMSMLQGISQTIRAAKYNDNELPAMMANLAASYFSQAIPSVMGAGARTIDNKARTTYIDKTKDIDSLTQSTYQKAISKIPFANQSLQPRVDAWGREDAEDNIWVRAFENFISPGYFSRRQASDTEMKIQELYDRTGDANIVPSKPQKYFKYNNKRVDLTAEQYTEYSKQVGRDSLNYATEILSSPSASNFSDGAKVEAIKDAYGYAERKARMKVSDYKISDTDLRAYIVEKEGIPYSSFALYRAALPKNPTKYDVAAAIKKLSISEEQKDFLWDLHYGKVKSRL